MFRRRRTSTNLPTIRHQGDTISIDSLPSASTDDVMRVNISPHNLRTSGTIGSAFISSSSSSSSRSSSPPVINPVRRSSRVETRRRIRHSTQTSTLSSRSRGVTAKPTEQVETSSRDWWNNTAHPACSSRHRNATPANAKPSVLSRRRALLRSPIFRLILSPEHSPPPTSLSPIRVVRSSDRSGGPSERRTQSRSSRSHTDDTIQIIHADEVSNVRPSRSRTTRTGTRGASLARRLTRSIRTGDSRPNPIASQTDSVDSAELHAALNAARSINPDGEDDCVICLDPKSNRSIVLPCMHTFCFECIYRWLCINPSCPLCKRLAHRVIHSILSDSDFTELLVSELQTRDNPPRRVTGLPVNFDSDEEDFRVDEPVSGQQQSHHHFHYHLGAPPVRFLDYLDGMTGGGSARTSLFIPPILIPSESSLSRSSHVTNVIDDPHRVSSYRWNPDFGSSSESRRSLLTALVNHALRPRDSSLLDSLLLRQLVYVFGLDSVPFALEPQLERNLTPNFLARNETQRQRLMTFVRRELRVLAPWLAYPSVSDSTATSREQSSVSSREGLASPAVTSPLICGAPGYLTDTPELDRITTRVVEHFTTTSITDEAALIELLSSLPELRPPLVPITYMSHFASEVLQFARYVGTLEQYDSAVCLYRRRVIGNVSTTPSENPTRSARNGRISDPRLAVYVASACWPRLRPGFSQPQGLITHPIINWLLQRLFVHSVSGASHPYQLFGTGQYPLLTPNPTVISPLSSTLCHPNCLRLACTSRALLEALPPPERLHIRSETRTLTTASSEHALHDNSITSSGRMTNAELYPNRLLYQRVLSELIDQARFSEALSPHFHEYHTRRSGAIQRNNTASVDSHVSNDSLDLQFADSLLSYLRCSQETTGVGVTSPPASPTSSSTEHPISNRLKPVLDAHPSAMRRLNGLLLLFTARIPGLIDSEEDWMGELLHTPLLPVAAAPPRTSQFIDLTATAQNTWLSTNQTRERNPRRPSFSGTDWNFLLQLPWNSLGDQSTRVTVPASFSTSEHSSDPELTVTIARDSQSVTFGTSHPPRLSLDSLSLGESRPRRSTSLLHQLTSTETGWRDPVPPCVVISSDSSTDEEPSHVRRTHSPYVLTADDSEEEQNADQSAQLPRTIRNADVSQFSPTIMAFGGSENRHPHSSPIRTDTSAPTLAISTVPHSNEPVCATSTSNFSKVAKSDDVIAAEEPMDVDERLDDGTPHTSSNVVIGTKRQHDTSTSSPPTSVFNESHRTTSPLPPKLAKMDAFLSNILKYLERTSTSKSTESLSRLLLSRAHTRDRSPSTRCPRHQTHRHSRSPIHLESTDSDCEVLREYISLDSRSSSFHRSRSRSSSCRSESSSCPSCRKNSHRASSHASHRPRRKQRCCCQSHMCHEHTHHRRRHDHTSCHKRRHKHRCGRYSPRCCLRQRHHQHSRRRPTVSINTHSSPILISDDSDTASSTPNWADLHGQPADATLEESQELKQETLSSWDQPIPSVGNQSPTPLPVTSDTTVVSHTQTTSTTNSSVTSPNIEGLKINIFNPTNASDFYRFLERFEFPNPASNSDNAVTTFSESDGRSIIIEHPANSEPNEDSSQLTPTEDHGHTDQLSYQTLLTNNSFEPTTDRVG